MPHTLGSVKFRDNADINNKEKGERRRQEFGQSVVKIEDSNEKKRQEREL